MSRRRTTIAFRIARTWLRWRTWDQFPVGHPDWVFVGRSNQWLAGYLRWCRIVLEIFSFNNGIVTWDVCSIKSHKIQTTPIPTKHELNKPTNESRSTQCRVTFHQNERTPMKTRRYIHHENRPQRVLIMDKHDKHVISCYYMTSLQTHLKCMAEQEANILIYTKVFRSPNSQNKRSRWIQVQPS